MILDIFLFILIFGGGLVLFIFCFVISFRKKYNNKKLDPSKRRELKESEEANTKWLMNLLPFLLGGVLAKAGISWMIVLLILVGWFILVALFNYFSKKSK
jgi:Na+/H+ antiporter NhaC